MWSFWRQDVPGVRILGVSCLASGRSHQDVVDRKLQWVLALACRRYLVRDLFELFYVDSDVTKYWYHGTLMKVIDVQN